MLKTLLTLALTGFSSLALAQNQDAVTIKYSYTFIQDRITPSPRNDVVTNVAESITLSGVNRINSTSNRESSGTQRNYSAMNVLGSGDGWKVVNKSTIRQIIKKNNYTATSTIKINGNSCQFSLSYRLNRGEKYRISRRLTNNEIAYWGNERVTNVRCEIL